MMGYYFLVIGIVILIFALWAFISHAALLFLGVHTSGTIVGVDEKMRYGGSRHKKTYYHPVIEFDTQDGETVTFTYGGASSTTPPEVGSRITVAYDANQPQRATINSFMGIWAGPLAAAILAAGTLYAGIQLVFFSN